MSVQCSIRGCKGKPYITFVGKGLMCKKHFDEQYEKINKDASKEERDHRKKIEKNFKKKK